MGKSKYPPDIGMIVDMTLIFLIWGGGVQVVGEGGGGEERVFFIVLLSGIRH